MPTFDSQTRSSAEHLLELALEEDLRSSGDLTSTALIAPRLTGTVSIVARQAGVLCGLPIVQMTFAAIDPACDIYLRLADGDAVEAGVVVADAAGPVRSLLAGERTALNFLTHLSGVASLTRRYVDAAAGTKAVILDTRKTLPGWRLLQKYAVRCGGGANHRLGLYDGVLIKDNHLAAWSAAGGDSSIAPAVRRARELSPAGLPIEVEVDTLEQLADALTGEPDIVLLDNMTIEQLLAAVALRDKVSPQVLLEASGGVTLETVGGIARSGVDRISIGALTHSAPALDLAFDWSHALDVTMRPQRRGGGRVAPSGRAR